MSKPHRRIAQCPAFLLKRKFCQYQQKTVEKQKLNFSGSALFHIENRVSLTYFVNGCRITKSNMSTFVSNNSELHNISYFIIFRNQDFVSSFFELVTQSKNLSFNFDLVTRKFTDRVNYSKWNFLFFNFELVSRSETFYF